MSHDAVNGYHMTMATTRLSDSAAQMGCRCNIFEKFWRQSLPSGVVPRQYECKVSQQPPELSFANEQDGQVASITYQ